MAIAEAASIRLRRRSAAHCQPCGATESNVSLARPEPLYECAADGPKEDFGDMANGESRTGRQCGVGRQRGNDKEPTYRAQIGYPASFHGLVVGDAAEAELGFGADPCPDFFRDLCCRADSLEVFR